MGSLVKRCRAIRKRQLEPAQKAPEGGSDVKRLDAPMSASNGKDEIQGELVLPTAESSTQSQFTPHFARSGLPLSRIDATVRGGSESRLQPIASSSSPHLPSTDMVIKERDQPYSRTLIPSSPRALSPPPVLTPQVHLASHNCPSLSERSELVAGLRREVAELNRERIVLRRQLRQQQLVILSLQRCGCSRASLKNVNLLRPSVRHGEIERAEVAANGSTSSVNRYSYSGQEEEENGVHASSLMECSSTDMESLEFDGLPRTVDAKEENDNATMADADSASGNHERSPAYLASSSTETSVGQSQVAIDSDDEHHVGRQNSRKGVCGEGGGKCELRMGKKNYFPFSHCKEEVDTSVLKSEIMCRAEREAGVKNGLGAIDEFQTVKGTLTNSHNDIDGSNDLLGVVAGMNDARTHTNFDNSSCVGKVTANLTGCLPSQAGCEKCNQAVTSVDFCSSDSNRQRDIDADEKGISSLGSDISSSYSPVIRMFVQEGAELPVDEISKVDGNESQKKKPTSIRRKLFVVDAGRLMQLFKLCPQCGSVVKFVDLWHNDAVPKLRWECTGRCGISEWTGHSDE
ncbi:hypothetical protein Tcan_18294 [Toxocara canis]|uniref:Uncharacterized protein n=1 Tax=Toxocara canis TaxID=6265 RepID=A0A0B2VEM6_TOXCA|nr:hypothetical protein Tcan_18294 [Toxocara canis]